MNRPLTAGMIMVAILAVMALAAPSLTRSNWIDSPITIHPEESLSPPSIRHWAGTDRLGRDVFSRLVHGGRTSLTVAMIATLMALLIGVPAGALAGFRGGWWDLGLTRLMEATAAFPGLVLLLLVVSMLPGDPERDGSARLLLLGGAIGVTRWATIARYVRGGVFKVRTEDYTAAAVALGSGRLRLLSRHLLPAALAPALISAAFGAGSAILTESALNFLGLGAREPLPSWGKMVATAAETPDAWWLVVAPGAAIAIVVLGFNLSAEGLRLKSGTGPGFDQASGGFRLPER
jgi:ABC-type dipeptide/oligopeptide/nickel transport system permease subunit